MSRRCIGLAMSDLFLSSDFTTEPYWTEGLPPLHLGAASPPPAADVVIIGGGFAGLSAAITLARGGRYVLVLEAASIGAGAAARAAGSLGHVPKASLTDLAAAYGTDTAHEVYREARAARTFVEQFIRDNRIDCDLRVGSRFVAAHSPRAFERQKAALPALRDTLGEVELVERSQVHTVIESDAFHGGVRIDNSATLQPALFLRALARLAIAAGAVIVEGTRALDVRRTGRGFEVLAEDGAFRANDVILATNADTGIGTVGFQSLRRRLIPMPAYALVTEELGEDVVRRILPVGGPVSDTYKIIHYIAPCMDGRRFVVSSRAGREDRNLQTKAQRMFQYFADRFPGLAGVKVSHCWKGTFAVTADWIPHLGVEDGVRYILGCCGTGIPMSTFLGFQAASRILDPRHPRSVFERPLPPLPFMGAGSLFLPLAVRAYDLRDRLLG
ncbi:MAG: FAD-binding oxidoreductase [Burkholderiales bacterium]|nr:FAD-binding oxidoreductase [Burkholderiales bacterium]